MPLNAAALNVAANAVAGSITHIGLVNAVGTEISGGSYARKAVAWTSAADGDVSPTTNLVFDIPAGGEVAGWRGYSALTLGTDYGGGTLATETFAGAGTYTLLAAGTAIDFDAV